MPTASSAGLSAIPADAQAEIFRRLDAIRSEHGAHILLAIESGSRAWGFPSPDSDYDVRFLYVLPTEDYLGLYPPRDVIEQPIEGLFDVNGWDLRKALGLLLRANPVLCEWLRSPIVYAEAPGFRDRMSALLTRLDERPAAQYHHCSLLKRNLREITSRHEIKLKKYFYALRPAYALLWMWENPDGRLPMAFDQLRKGVHQPDSLRNLVDQFVVTKMETREIGTGARIDELDNFLQSVLDRAESMEFGRQPQQDAELTEACVDCFRTYARGEA